MYATIFQSTLDTVGSAEERGRTGRSLATALAALPGFLAFIALDSDPARGTVTLVCLFDGQSRIAATEGVIAQWEQDAQPAGERRIRQLGTGAVIAQKGL
jgi:hypothetical protein